MEKMPPSPSFDLWFCFSAKMEFATLFEELLFKYEIDRKIGRRDDQGKVITRLDDKEHTYTDQWKEQYRREDVHDMVDSSVLELSEQQILERAAAVERHDGQKIEPGEREVKKEDGACDLRCDAEECDQIKNQRQNCVYGAAGERHRDLLLIADAGVALKLHAHPENLEGDFFDRYMVDF